MSRLARGRVAGVVGAALLVLGLLQAPARAEPLKVLRYAFPIAESSFDPAQITDLYSRTVVAAIFDAPLEYEFLARPARLRPNTAAALPDVSSDYRTYTFRIKPGITFADDPAFGARPRELTAADYIYSIKRHYDPRWKSGNLYLLENAKILGLSELRQELIKAGKPFDYDRDVEGLRQLDRYTFQVRLGMPNPRFIHYFADAAIVGALAREVVDAHGDRIGEHPVGTGPFRLAHWTRSSRIVLDRNPGYRSVRYDERPADPGLQATAAQLKGRKLPMVDRVEVAIIEEPQPRWLSFLNEEQDVQENVPFEFIDTALPNNRLAPHMVKRGIYAVRYARPDIRYTYFAMEHPVVGGNQPHKVALRRAIGLAVDLEAEIKLVMHDQGVVAQSTVGPETWGYDPEFKSEMSVFDRARAKALLDLYGYVDRDGDGWRDQPDGTPLRLEMATQPDQRSRRLIELWQKNMDAIGIRITFLTAKWPENLKSSRAGKLMMWTVGWSATLPDADTFLALGYGPNKGQANHSRFDLPAFNKLYEAQRLLPDGPEREALMREAKKLLIAYMPVKVHLHNVWTDLAHPWVIGYHRNIFVRDFWKYVDIDSARLAARQP